MRLARRAGCAVLFRLPHGQPTVELRCLLSRSMRLDAEHTVWRNCVTRRRGHTRIYCASRTDTRRLDAHGERLNACRECQHGAQVGRWRTDYFWEAV